MFRHFKDLEKLADALHVEHFATMGDELRYVNSPQDSVVEVSAWMEANDFSIVPVKKDGEKSFFVDRKNLKGLADGEVIANHMKLVDSNKFVEKDTSIKDALKELGERGWFFVGSGNDLHGIVTLEDLSKPAVSFYLLSHLLMLESGLRRLLGSYNDIQIPDAAPEYSDTFTKIINQIFKTKDLINDLELPLTEKPFKKKTRRFIDLRNALAHGRSVLDEYNNILDATDCIHELESLLEKTASLTENRTIVWEKFVETQIVKHIDSQEIGKFINIREIWAGTNAMLNLPMNYPIYVISAANPLEEVLTDKENNSRHCSLDTILGFRKLKFEEVFGESPCGGWSEASFAIEGMDKESACELAKKFGQRAIFELTQDEIRVISVDKQHRKTKPRCR